MTYHFLAIEIVEIVDREFLATHSGLRFDTISIAQTPIGLTDIGIS